jgi:hypothetical protein
MDYPRRSARLSPHASNTTQPSQTWAPAFGGSSQTSSTTTTSYPSPTNDAESDQNNTSQSPPQYRHPPHLTSTSSMSQPHLKAPLPSPSAGDIDTFFARPHSHPNPYQSSDPQRQPQQQQAALHPPANQYHHAPHHNSFSHDNNTSNQPGFLPADFLAEAAKRAGMACLARDLGDVSL